MPTDNILGKRIKSLRYEANLTQEQFGKIFGLAKSTVSQYESGSSRPDDELKKKFATYFNVSLDWLLGLTDERHSVNMVKETQVKYEAKSTSNPMLDDLLKKVPDLTDEEKESLAEHLEFAMKQIEKERQRRAKIKDN